MIFVTDVLPLLIGAATVAILHMSAPDHWATLCFLSQSSGWNRRKLLGISFATATGHALLSAVLGFGIALAGILVSRLIASYISTAIGFVMLVAGLFISVTALLSNRKREVTPEEKLLEKEKRENASKLNGIVGSTRMSGFMMRPWYE